MDIAKTASERFTQFAEAKTERLKGLSQAVAVVVAAFAFHLGVESDKLSLLQLASIWYVGYVAYRIGSRLDYHLFDPLYGANKCAREPRRWYHPFIDCLPGARMLMYASRAQAAQMLGAGERTDGLYETAKTLFSRSEAWAEEIKPLLAWSKAARTLAVLLLFSAAYDGVLAQAAHYGISWTKASPSFATAGWRNRLEQLFLWWPCPLVLSMAALLVYLTLRIRYMNALYALVCEANVRRFECPDTNPGARPGAIVELIAVGSVVVPVTELPLLNTPPKRRDRSVGAAKD